VFLSQVLIKILLVIKCGCCLTAVDNKLLLFACFVWLEAKYWLWGNWFLTSWCYLYNLCISAALGAAAASEGESPSTSASSASEA